jgi:hypothetical protein
VLIGDPLQASFAREIGPDQLKLDLNAVPPLAMDGNASLRVRPEGQTHRACLSSPRGSVQFRLCAI